MTSETAKRIIPTAIKTRLASLGWSQADLARETGITTATISNICGGIHEPRASMLKTIADAIGVPADALLSEPHGGFAKKKKEMAGAA